MAPDASPPPAPAPDTTRPDIAEAGAGMVADVAVAGLRYVKGTTKKRGPDLELERVLDKLEAHRGLGLGLSPGETLYNAEKLSGGPPEPRRMQQLHNAILDDMLAIVNTRLDHHEAEETKLLEAAGSTAAVGGAHAANLRACVMYDIRKVFLGVLLLIAVMIAVWEVTLRAVERELPCSDLDDADVGLSNCLDAAEQVHAWGTEFLCSRYTCAAPWSPAPGVEPCTSCNCGTACDACEQCMCTLTTGTVPAHQVCKAKDRYTGGWGEEVRVVLLCVGAVLLCLGLCKWSLSVVVSSKKNGSVAEQKKIRHRFAKRKTELKKLKKDILMHRIGGDAWKVEEPHSAFTRRMKTKLGDHDYKRMRAGNAGVHHHSTTTGEATALVTRTQTDIAQSTSNATPHPLVPVPSAAQPAQTRETSSTRPGPASPTSQVSPGARRMTVEDGVLWYDENEVLVVEECKAYYARVKAALPGGKVPNRRLLFAQLESGTAPAGSLMQFHVKELRRLVGNHPEADVPITCEVFVSEWLEIIAELQNMVFEAEPKEEKDDADEEGAGTAGKLFGVMKTLGLSAGDEEEEYTTSEEDDESDDNPMVPLVKGVPHLLAMLRGAPPPTREQAVQQRQGILAAMHGLQNLTGGAASRVEVDSDSDQSQEPLMSR